MFKILNNKKLKYCFPKIEIVLNIYHVLMITNGSSENHSLIKFKIHQKYIVYFYRRGHGEIDLISLQE